MARPHSALSKFVLSLPRDLPVKEVLAKVKAKGMKTTENNIYRVRRLAKKPTRKAAGGAASRSRVASSGGSSSSAEALLRAVAAEVGLSRALEVLQAERSKVRALIGK